MSFFKILFIKISRLFGAIHRPIQMTGKVHINFKHKHNISD